MAPTPSFIPSSCRIGPFTTEIDAQEVVLLERAEMPVADIASTTGRYSGRQPAITALTATFSTSKAQASRKDVGRIWPTILSAVWEVPFSICSTLCSVGRMIGRQSVQFCSRNSWRRLSGVSGSSRRGVDRSKEAPFRSSAVRAPVRPSMTSCMKGRLETGSALSI